MIEVLSDEKKIRIDPESGFYWERRLLAFVHGHLPKRLYRNARENSITCTAIEKGHASAPSNDKSPEGAEKTEPPVIQPKLDSRAEHAEGN